MVASGSDVIIGTSFLFGSISKLRDSSEASGGGNGYIRRSEKSVEDWTRIGED